MAVGTRSVISARVDKEAAIGRCQLGGHPILVVFAAICALPAGHKIYPYLLRNLPITRADQVWASDIIQVPLRHGFLYPVAVMNWYSRYVLAWRLSNTLDGAFCCEALEKALSLRRPEIFNSDQGAQFTAMAFMRRLEVRGVTISTDGRGRALENVLIGWLWRSVKYEDVYLRDYADGCQSYHMEKHTARQQESDGEHSRRVHAMAPLSEKCVLNRKA